MTYTKPSAFVSHIARNEADLNAAYRLRYKVFVEELAGDGPLVDHKRRLEKDRFDEHADHLILRDEARAPDDQVIGVYRLMTRDAADKAGAFYCEDEFDLSVLKQSGRTLLELGRSCLHPDYRGGTAMMHLWAGLAEYVAEHQIDVLFGVASFHGTDLLALRDPLSLLHHKHLAPSHLRVVALPSAGSSFSPSPADQIDRVAAMRATPALIKAYLRLGGSIGEGVFVDEAFNTTDVCMIVEAASVSSLQRSIYTKGATLG